MRVNAEKIAVTARIWTRAFISYAPGRQVPQQNDCVRRDYTPPSGYLFEKLAPSNTSRQHDILRFSS